MPNGQTDYERWYEGLPRWLRGLARPPVEIARPREAPARPTEIAGVAPRAWEALAGLTPEERAGLQEQYPQMLPITEEPAMEQIARRRREEEEAEKVARELGKPGEIEPRPTEPPPEGFEWRYDKDLNRWVPQFTGLTAQQRSQQELQRQQLELQRQQQAGFPAPGQPPTDAFGRVATWSTRLGEWDYPPNWGQRPLDEPAAVTPWQQQQFGLQERELVQAGTQFQAQLQFQQQQAQMMAAEQERQYTSQLAAQPISWLQYAAYTGEEPVVQPWMIPLGFQETGGQVTPQGLQIGQPIPGFEGQVGQRDIQTFAGLPQLTTPSAQLQARWGPTAQAQFLGYRQARTGARPEETQFRLGAGRAPTGRFPGFSGFR